MQTKYYWVIEAVIGLIEWIGVNSLNFPSVSDKIARSQWNKVKGMRTFQQILESKVKENNTQQSLLFKK